MLWFLRGLIRGYQLFISPLLAPRCRYIPTCSQYALEAISHYGSIQGSYLAIRRICRCHPWGGSGYDPVPISLSKQIIVYYVFLNINTVYFVVPLSQYFIQHHFSLFRIINYAKVG